MRDSGDKQPDLFRSLHSQLPSSSAITAQNGTKIAQDIIMMLEKCTHTANQSTDRVEILEGQYIKQISDMLRALSEDSSIAPDARLNAMKYVLNEVRSFTQRRPLQMSSRAGDGQALLIRQRDAIAKVVIEQCEQITGKSYAVQVSQPQAITPISQNVIPQSKQIVDPPNPGINMTPPQAAIKTPQQPNPQQSVTGQGVTGQNIGSKAPTPGGATVSFSIAKQFERDKGNTIGVAQSFMHNADENSSYEMLIGNISELRQQAFGKLAAGAPDQNITAAIDLLERAREMRAGIVVSKRKIDDNGRQISVMVRDARNALKSNDPKRLGPEAFEMQYLNEMRALIDVLNNDLTLTVQQRQDALLHVRKEIQNFADNVPLAEYHKAGASQEQLGTLVKVKAGEVIDECEKITGKKYLFERVNVAKDFQNFKHEQANIISITDLGNGESALEIEVGLRGMTDAQKAEYKAIDRMGKIRKAFEETITHAPAPDWTKRPTLHSDLNELRRILSQEKPIKGDANWAILQDFANAYTQSTGQPSFNIRNGVPQWYSVMPVWEQKMVEGVASKVASGQYVIPTQLRQITGLRNAFEKVTAVARDNPDSAKGEEAFKVVTEAKHAGTIAGFSRGGGKERKKISQAMTDSNAEQLEGWSGSNSVHVNTLNSPNNPANKKDRTLVKRGARAIENVMGEAGRYTNTAFNALRRFTGANDYSDAKEAISKFANDVDTMLGKIDNKDSIYYALAALKNNAYSVVDPQVIDNFKSGGTPYPWIIDKNRTPTPVDKALREALVSALELREAIKSAEKVSWKNLIDKENKNLNISEKMNRYNQAVKQHNKILAERPTPDFTQLDATELLTTCASGKDRTGLAMHNISAEAIARETGRSSRDVDPVLLKGSTAKHNAGSPAAGGATIGCYGTKNETKPGIPQGRKEALSEIVEASAANNVVSRKDYKQARDIEAAILPKNEQKQPKGVVSMSQIDKNQMKDAVAGLGRASKPEKGSHAHPMSPPLSGKEGVKQSQQKQDEKAEKDPHGGWKKEGSGRVKQ